MAEWLKATVLKTVNVQAFVGSNPTPSVVLSPELQDHANGLWVRAIELGLLVHTRQVTRRGGGANVLSGLARLGYLKRSGNLRLHGIFSHYEKIIL